MEPEFLYRCFCGHARQRGAIGIFYGIEAFVYAESPKAAEDKYRKLYECNTAVTVGLVPSNN